MVWVILCLALMFLAFGFAFLLFPSEIRRFFRKILGVLYRVPPTEVRMIDTPRAAAICCLVFGSAGLVWCAVAFIQIAADR